MLCLFTLFSKLYSLHPNIYYRASLGRFKMHTSGIYFFNHGIAFPALFLYNKCHSRKMATYKKVCRGRHNMLIFFLSMLETDENKNKFTLLYEKYRKLMFYVANQILKDKYLSEDAVEQTFVKIIENIDNISDVDCHKTKSYIVIMVKNCAINLYRQRKSHPTVSLDEDIELADDRPFEIDEADALTRSIARLPIIYKNILTLKYVQEFPNKEIARLLGISEPTVRKRLERAKEKVQQLLNEETNKNAD